MSDARDRDDARLGENASSRSIVAHSQGGADRDSRARDRTVEEHTAGAVRRDDLTMVRVKS